MANLLTVYRQILKAAKLFPSKKRLNIIEDIKHEFRLGARATDTKEVDKRREQAIQGLSQLQEYVPTSAVGSSKGQQQEQSIFLKGPLLGR